MKRRLLWFLPGLLVLILVGIPAIALAASYYIPITVINESGGSDYDRLPIIEDINNSKLAELGYIDDSGNDTRVTYAGTELKHMVSSDKVVFVAPDVKKGLTYKYHYTMDNEPLGFFTIIPGYEGYISVGTTFPTVEAVNGGNNNESTTDHTVNLPTGIVSGDLLLVFFASDTLTITFPGGWTELFSTANGSSLRFECHYRVADGNEGSTITVTTSPAERTAHTSYRITNYTGLPEAGTATGSDDSPNPPSLTPTWGAGNNLWIASCGYDRSAGPLLTGYPNNYTGGRNDYNESTSGYGVGSAWRELVTLSEDPGSFDLNLADQWVAGTVAIQPLQGPALVGNNFIIEQKGYIDTSAVDQSYYRPGITDSSVEEWDDITHLTYWVENNTDQESTRVHLGTYSAKIEYNGYIYQDIPWDDSYIGKEFTFNAWTWTSTTGKGRIGIDDGDGTTWSSYNDEDDIWVQQTVTRTLSSSADQLRLRFDNNGASSSYYTYCDGPMALIYPDELMGSVLTCKKGAISIYVDDGSIKADIHSAPEISVTASEVSSGDHEVKVTADGTNLKIYVDDELKDSVALNGGSVPDTANSWYLMQNNVMPYMDYFKLTVGGTPKARYQPNTMISGSTLPDMSGNNKPATITWGTNPGTISVSHDSLTILTLQQMTEAEEQGYLELFGEVPTEIGGFFDAENYTVLPGSEVISELATVGGIPLKLFWVPVLFSIAIVIGLFVFDKTRHIMAVAIGTCIMLGIFCGIGMLPWWVMVPYGLLAVTMVIMEKTYGF